MDHRSVARILAAGRVAIGAVLLAIPGLVARSWIGPTGRSPGPKLLVRAVGIRDLGLGLGVINALERGDPRAEDWVRAGAIADAGDAVATVLAFRHLPPRSRFGVILLAAGATAVGLAAAENLD